MNTKLQVALVFGAGIGAIILGMVEAVAKGAFMAFGAIIVLKLLGYL